jgi:nitrogen fixation protein NifZ
MSGETSNSGCAKLHRVCRHWRRAESFIFARQREFALGEEIRSLRPIKNDGIYPHKEIGELLVHRGDAGIVRGRWSFLGDIYYTVEFAARAAVVIMRDREMISLVSC